MRAQNEQGESWGIENQSQESEGYWNMFHAAEEELYGPKSPTSSRDKILRYLLHSELRWPEGHPAGAPKTRDEISKHTGATHKQIRDAVKVLKGLVEVINCKIDNVWQPTRYRITRQKIAQFRVPKDFKLSLVKGGVSQKTSDPSDENRQTLLPNRSDQTHLNTGNDSGIRKAKQSVKTKCLNNTTGEMVESKGIDWEKAKAKILKKYPGDEARLDTAFGQISTEKKYKTTEVGRPAGFILKCWESIRDTYAFADEVKRLRRKQELPTPEEAIDEDKSARVRDMVMGAFFNRSLNQ